MTKNKHDEKVEFKYNLSHYFDFLKEYKWLFIMIVIVIIISQILKISDKFLFKFIIDYGEIYLKGELLRSSYVQILIAIAISFVFVIIFRTISKWVLIHLVNRLDGDMILDLKRRYFSHILSLSHSFHTDHKTGSLISRLNRSGRAMERMSDVITFQFIPVIVQVAIIFFSLVYFDFISAVMIGITAIAFIIYSLFFQFLQQEASIYENKVKDWEKANIADMFSNIDTIKYFGRERSVNTEFRKMIDRTKKAFVERWDYFRWLEAGQVLILGIGTFFLMYFPIIKFLDGNMTLGTLTFIFTVYGSLVGPLFMFVHGIRGFYRVMADFQALFKYSKINNEIENKKNAKNLKIEKGEIEFKNLSFQYRKRRLFEDFKLKIPAGKKIAFVGRSGCGKTTLVKLLFRLYDPQLGGVFIDGKNIKDFNKNSVRQQMSVVPQETILFDDTIYNNIKFSRPSAKKKEVMEAIKFAHLDELIERLPEREKTIVGERGVKLSGGEKQRVSIARAILADKKVLILDEATSSLDSETEKEIQEDLEKLMEDRTSIIVAHRLSTIMNADKIVVLKNGRIVEQGKHKDLIKKNGEYSKLWKIQEGKK